MNSLTRHEKYIINMPTCHIWNIVCNLAIIKIQDSYKQNIQDSSWKPSLNKTKVIQSVWKNITQIAIVIVYFSTLFSRLLMLTLIFLGIIINLLSLYRLSYFVLLIIFVYFCVLVLTL
jgi:hypothetical protein